LRRAAQADMQHPILSTHNQKIESHPTEAGAAKPHILKCQRGKAERPN
jgi:hypothetical protein